jgi:hypothetical protein
MPTQILRTVKIKFTVRIPIATKDAMNRPEYTSAAKLKPSIPC